MNSQNDLQYLKVVQCSLPYLPSIWPQRVSQMADNNDTIKREYQNMLVKELRTTPSGGTGRGLAQ